MRIAGIVLLIGVFLYSIFGSLAAGEPGTPPAWKVGYALVGIASLAGALWVGWPRRKSGNTP